MAPGAPGVPNRKDVHAHLTHPHRSRRRRCAGRGRLPAAAGPVDPEANQAEYWEVDGTTCTKYEFTDGFAAWVLPALEDAATYESIVLKAGRDNTVVFAPEAGIAYVPENEKDISHVIVCIGEDLGGDETGGDDTGGEEPPIFE